MNNINFTKRQIYYFTGAAGIIFILSIIFTIWNIKTNLYPDLVVDNKKKVIEPSKNNSNNTTNDSNGIKKIQPAPNAKVYSPPPAPSYFGNIASGSEDYRLIDETISEFFKAVTEKQYDKAFGYLHPNFIQKNNISQEKAANYFQRKYPFIASFEIRYIDQEESTGFIRAKLVLKIQESDSNLTYYVDDNSTELFFEWISGKPRLYIPDMTTIQ